MTGDRDLPRAVAERLASPCCREPITNMSCAACGRAFPAVAGVPALFDFDRTVIELGELQISDAASPIERSGRGHLKRFFDGGNPVAEGNIARLLDLLPANATVLVVGGATVGKGTEALYAGGVTLVSFDIYVTDLTDLLADAHQIPFQDQTFDAVIVQAVLEHVLEPHVAVAEIWRVLRPDGIVYAETPFMQQVHEGPYDFTRFTESGHRWLFRDFQLIGSGVVAGPGYGLLWTIDYLVRALVRSRRAGLRARKLMTPIRFLDRWVDRRFSVDAASAVYFLGRRSETPITPREAVAHYLGAQR